MSWTRRLNRRVLNSRSGRRFGGLAPRVLAACAGLATFLSLDAAATGLTGGFAASGVEIPIFAGNSSQTVARWKIDRIFTDHRRLGLFRVKLLPVLVAQGVRLEFTQAQPLGNTPENSPFKLAPTLGRGTTEWRDFGVFFPTESTARVHANRARPVAQDRSTVWLLEEVTLQTGDQRLSLPRAELSLEEQPGRVRWPTAGATLQWNFFTGKWNTNAVTTTLKQGS